MEKRLWKIKEGFIFGACLLLIGVVLQLCVGSFDLSLVAWPVNIILLAIYVTVLILCYVLRKKVYFFEWSTTLSAAIPSLVMAGVLAVVLGCMTSLELLSSWPFIIIYVWMTSVVGLACVKRIVHFCSWKKDMPFLLNHLGLFMALVSATIGNADLQKLKMYCETGLSECRAIDDDNKVHELPFCIELRNFTLEEYSEGKPKRFASEITVSTREGKKEDAIIEVNHPYGIEGWKIYQLSYDVAMGKWSTISVFELVKDPWLPVVYTGVFMLIAGALWMFLAAGVKRKKETVVGLRTLARWNYKRIILYSTVLLLVFICINIFESVIQGKELMPALQSPWFAPHVVIYMFCYTMLGAAFLTGVFILIKGGKGRACEIADNLVCVGLSFMTIGMLFGALWAKEAWGHYWAWDPKETWAAATWFLYLTYLHLRFVRPKKMKIAAWLLIISFCCLQMCWWGINYLPSVQGRSVHTYNLN